MKFCPCGTEVQTKHGKLCPVCLHHARSMAGKSSSAKINYAKREAMKQAERRTQETPVPVIVKCPTCWIRRTVMLPPSMVTRGIMPRIYCELHEGNRTRTIYTFGTEARV